MVENRLAIRAALFAATPAAFVAKKAGSGIAGPAGHGLQDVGRSPEEGQGRWHG
jgi:hypothetical protein